MARVVDMAVVTEERDYLTNMNQKAVGMTIDERNGYDDRRS